MVFYVWASIFCFGAIMFSIFARGKTQDWALEEADKPIKSSRSIMGKSSGKFSLGHVPENDEKL